MEIKPEVRQKRIKQEGIRQMEQRKIGKELLRMGQRKEEEEVFKVVWKRNLILLPLSVRAAGQLADIARILTELTGAFAERASAGAAENR